MIITLQMSLFRNNISQRLMLDESTTDDTGLNMSNMQMGFKKGCVEQEKSFDQQELSYQAPKLLVIKGD